jgi:hypothetical protein
MKGVQDLKDLRIHDVREPPAVRSSPHTSGEGSSPHAADQPPPRVRAGSYPTERIDSMFPLKSTHPQPCQLHLLTRNRTRGVPRRLPTSVLLAFAQVPTREKIFIELMMSDRKLLKRPARARNEGSGNHSRVSTPNEHVISKTSTFLKDDLYQDKVIQPRD